MERSRAEAVRRWGAGAAAGGAAAMTVLAARDRLRQRAERSARGAAEHMAELAARLSAAATHHDVVGAAASMARAQHGVAATTLWLLDPEDERRWRRWHPGSPAAVHLMADGALPIDQCRADGRPVLLPDAATIIRTFPAATTLIDRAGIRAAATFPAFDGDGRTIGGIGFGWDRTHHCGPSEIAQLETVARLCAETARRIDALAELEHRQLATEQRAAFGMRLATAVSVPDTAAAIADTACTLLAADGVIVTRRDEDGDALVVTAAIGAGTDGAQDVRYVTTKEGGPSYDAIREQRLVLVPDRATLRARYPDRPDLVTDPAIGAVAAVPLIAGDRPVGAVRLHYRAEELPLSLLEEHAPRFAEQAAQALERAHLAERQRAALEQANHLRDAVAALAGAVDEAAVTAAVRDGGARALGCVSATLLVRDEERPDRVRPATSTDTIDRAPTAPVDPTSAVGAAIREGRSVYASRRGTRTGTDRREPPADEARAVLPLVVGPQCVGALVVQWDALLAFSGAERYVLESYAEYVAQALMRVSIAAREHEIVTALQQQLLPQVVPEVAGARIAARYRPASRGLEIGGDWYDVIPLSPTRTAFVVGDVVGKGPSAAAHMGQMRTAVRTKAPDADPGTLLAALDGIVEHHLAPEFMVTVAYCVFDALGRSVSYASAGHCPGLLLHADGTTEWLGATRPPVGIPWDHTRTVVPVEISTTARFVLFTDGLVERRGESIDVGLERLRAQVSATRDLDAEGAADAILAALAAPGTQSDDIALVVADLTPAPAPLEERIPADAGAATAVRSRLADWLGQSFVADEVAVDVLIATNEAVANAVEHGSADASATVHLHAERTDGAVRIRIADGGSNAEPHPDPDRGRGLAIMRALMDEVDVATSLVGTTVRMERALD